MPTTRNPASRPPGSAASLAPETWATAMPSIEPIIHGNGVPSHAQSAPPAVPAARPPSQAAARDFVSKWEWLAEG